VMSTGASEPLFGQSVEPGTSDLHLKKYISDGGFRKVLLVTGKQSFIWFEEKGFVPLLEQEVSVLQWSNFLPNPDIDELREGLALAEKYRPDVIIGIGGGSVLDMAKLLAALLDNPAKSQDLFVEGSSFDNRKVALALVPTTAGSGAESTHFAVLYRKGVKYSVTGRALIANHITLDPELLKTGLADQLAASGLDALSQCIESLWSRRSTSSSFRYAEEALELLAQNLVPFVGGEADRARQMQWASHLSGQAINISRTTGPHALSYYLTSEHRVPHGIAAASTVGYFIDHHNDLLQSNFYSSSNVLGKSMDVINRRLGLRGGTGVAHFRQLFSQLGLSDPETYWPATTEGRKRWLSSANADRLQNHPTNLPDLVTSPWRSGSLIMGTERD